MPPTSLSDKQVTSAGKADDSVSDSSDSMEESTDRRQRSPVKMSFKHRFRFDGLQNFPEEVQATRNVDQIS